MTQTSFNNYKDHVEKKLKDISSKLSLKYYNNVSSYIYDELNLSLISLYFEILDKYTLVAEDETGEYEDNFLTPTEMQQIAEWYGRTFGFQYYIDFILTDDDLYPAIPSIDTGDDVYENAITTYKINAY